MLKYLILAAMKGDFLAESGHVYDSFQMLGYVQAQDHFAAIRMFFEEPQFPIDWGDVIYMWAELLEDHSKNGHYGELDRIYVEQLGRAIKGDS